MALYRTTAAVTYVAGGTSITVNEIGTVLDLDATQAAALTGKIVNFPAPPPETEVLSYDSREAFPSSGNDANIYLATNTGRMYRWSDLRSAYTSIPGVPLGDFYRPLRGIASGVTSAITNGESKAATFIPWSSAAGQYRYAGCVPEAMSGDASLCVNNNNTKSALFVLQPITMEFWSNATDLRMHGYGIGKADVWALVDDMHIMAGWQHSNLADNYCTWALTQGTAVWRKYRVCVCGPFSGISINTGADIVPTAPGFQLAVIGDSLVQGNVNTANAVAPGTAGLLTAGAVFGEFEQITGLDVWRYGIYGTGYVAYSDFGADGPYGSAARMAKVNAGPDFDAIIAFGTLNDGAATTANVVSAAKATWSAIKAGNPNATLIVVGPEDAGYVSPTLDSMNSALLAAASAHRDVSAIVDVRTANFITGTGYDGTVANDGNSDAFTSGDATHPTHAGARYWAEHLARLLKPVRV